VRLNLHCAGIGNRAVFDQALRYHARPYLPFRLARIPARPWKSHASPWMAAMLRSVLDASIFRVAGVFSHRAISCKTLMARPATNCYVTKNREPAHPTSDGPALRVLSLLQRRVRKANSLQQCHIRAGEMKPLIYFGAHTNSSIPFLDSRNPMHSHKSNVAENSAEAR